jgi:hypothetical protein
VVSNQPIRPRQHLLFTSEASNRTSPLAVATSTTPDFESKIRFTQKMFVFDVLVRLLLEAADQAAIK